ncbi:MAG: DUF389 domain-containing protein [Bacteroidota bacterium]
METIPKPKIKRERRNLGEVFRDFWEGILEWFRDFVNLESGLDREGTIIRIRKGMRMRGESAWLLICSIMIASLGLDLNSPAVIIGAMLVSPLMSPILGVGLAVGINDKNMLWVSLQHYGVAILITLITSYIYFSLTPFGDITTEISSRTKPTTLDVLVAFFGGIAGIISGSRKDQSNAIPGVAIATALMPPLCVTGFGLATGRWDVMFNSFYLFFFNAFFVALATFLIVRMLNFEEREYATASERRNTHLLVLGFSILMIVPSAFILRGVLEDIHRKNELNNFVETYFSGETSCIDYEIQQIDSVYLVKLQLIGAVVNEDSIAIYEQKLTDRLQETVVLSLVQDDDVELARLSKMQLELQTVRQLANKIQSNYERQVSKEEAAAEQARLDSLAKKTIPLPELGKEAKLFLEDIESLSFAEMQSTDFEQYEAAFPTLLVRWKNKRYNAESRRKNEEKLRQFVQQRAKLDTLRVISY